MVQNFNCRVIDSESYLPNGTYNRLMQIGDEDTGKNRRIDQRVIWTTESQKKTQVLDILRRYGPEDRVRVLLRTKTYGYCTAVIVLWGGRRVLVFSVMLALLQECYWCRMHRLCIWYCVVGIYCMYGRECGDGYLDLEAIMKVVLSSCFAWMANSTPMAFFVLCVSSYDLVMLVLMLRYGEWETIRVRSAAYFGL